MTLLAMIRCSESRKLEKGVLRAGSHSGMWMIIIPGGFVQEVHIYIRFT